MSQPTPEEIIQALREAHTAAYSLTRSIEVILDRHDSATLPSQILAEARRLKQKRISVSWIQRRFNYGYSRAARLLDDMEAQGLVEPAISAKIIGRRILK